MNESLIEYLGTRIAQAIEESNRIANEALAVNRELLEIMKKAQEVKP